MIKNKTTIFIVSTLVIFFTVGFFISTELNKTDQKVREEELQLISGVDEYKDKFGEIPLGVVLDNTRVSFDGSKKQVMIKGNKVNALTELFCERIHVSKSKGICLFKDPDSDNVTVVQVFEISNFEVLFTLAVNGVSSRTRISDDEKYAAFTVFVFGDSYASSSFSTRTYIIDMEKKDTISTLESFTLKHNGETIEPIDRNYWGMTFNKDSNYFYATMQYNETPYLVKGNIAENTVEVIFDNLECPSLSPDESKIVFKKMMPNAMWRLTLLDLKTMTESPLNELNNVDDQAEWLDNENILYGTANSTGNLDIMSLGLNADSKPQLFIDNASSPGIF